MKQDPIAMRLCVAVVAGLGIGRVFGFAPAAALDIPSSIDPTAPSAVADPFPELNEVRLAVPKGHADEEAYVHSIDARAEKWASEAETLDDRSAATALWISAANLTLAHQLDRVCTMRLLELDVAANVPSLERSREAMTRALVWLSRADETLASLDEEPENGAEDELMEYRHRAQTVRAYVPALRLMLWPLEGEERDRATRQASSLLAPLLEDPRPPVAAAASFWQANLRATGSEPARALSALEFAVANPPRGAMPHAFFARLLRCRLAAKSNGYAAAAALLMQVEERCGAWFDDELERAQAMRAAQLVRLQTMSAWYDSLGREAKVREQQWCADRARQLVQEHFADGTDTVLRLSPVIPVLVPAAEEKPMGEPSPVPTPNPTSQD